MEKKGGETEQDNNRSISKNYVDSKIALTAVFVIIFGIVFIFCLVLFGLQVSSRSTKTISDDQKSDNSRVLESIDVVHEDTTILYKIPDDGRVKTKNVFMEENGISNEEYAIINNNSELDDFVRVANQYNIDKQSVFAFALDRDFFRTSTIIAISKESAGLENVSVEKVTRDQDYNIHIEAKYLTLDNDEQDIRGGVSFIKIQNIQPKTVILHWTEEDGSGAQYKTDYIGA